MKYPIELVIPHRSDNEWISIIEAREIIHQLLDQIRAQKVKCPTCRCRIIPGETCYCCAGRGCESDE